MAWHKAGSALLMILFFSSTLCLMILGVWQNALYTLEAALTRMTYSQVFASTQGLMNVAIELSIENYEKLALSDQETRIEIPEYVIIQNKPHTGIIFFKGAKDHVLLKVQLKLIDTALCTLRCQFSQQPEGGYSISAWAIETQS